MLKVQSVRLDEGQYGEGFSCTVTFQVGEYSYNKTAIELPPQATRKIVELAIAEAKAMLTSDASGVVVKGEPITVPLKAGEPEFAEVGEAPAPLVAEAELAPVSKDAF